MTLLASGTRSDSTSAPPADDVGVEGPPAVRHPHPPVAGRPVDERTQVAMDLHDFAIQRLFAAGLTLGAVRKRMEPGREAERLQGAIEDLDSTISELRGAIATLRQTSRRTAGVAEQVREITRSATRALGFPPLLVLDLAEDLPGDLGRDLVAVLSEALSNAARHANASWVTVQVQTDSDELRIRVTDGGVGVQSSQRRSGLSNLAVRAERRGGTMRVFSSDRGTTVSWAVPLAGPHA